VVYNQHHMAKELITVDVLNSVAARIAEGQTLTSACKSLKIKRGSVYNALLRHPQLLDVFALAREANAEAMADETIKIADSEKDAQKARVRVDVRKWIARCNNPKKYGEKLDLNVTQTVDIVGAMSEANARMRPMCDQANVIDAQVIDKTIEHARSTADSESVGDADLPDFLR
jgi:hypothetical protein